MLKKQWKYLATIILIVSIPYLVVFLRPGNEPVTRAPAFEKHRVLNIAHRGGALEAPENTIYAFKKAWESGADVLEMDIYASADGVLFVLHDTTLDRTTSGSGLAAEKKWSELKMLDAAYHWNPGFLPKPPYRGRGIGIPSLEEVFETFPETPMIVEIKPNDPGIVPRLGMLIDRYQRWDRTIIASFHQGIINRVRNNFPDSLTSAGRSEVGSIYFLRIVGLDGLVTTSAHSYQLPERVRGLNMLSRGMLKTLRKKGIDVHVWAINDESDMRRLILMGVQGILTDRPSVLAKIIKEYYNREDETETFYNNGWTRAGAHAAFLYCQESVFSCRALSAIRCKSRA